LHTLGHQFCTIPAVRAELRHTLPSTVDAARIQTAATEAASLAELAYGEGEANALGHAERLLYAIHAANSFSAPVLSGVVSVIWSTLMRRKLSAVLVDPIGVTGLTLPEMTARLRAALQEADERDNSAIDRFTAASDLGPITRYVKNWYCSTHGFTHQIIATVQRCNGIKTLHPAFMSTLENLMEEFASTPHPELRQRLPRRLGIDYSVDGALEDPDHLTEAFALQNLRTGLCSLRDPTYALGCFFSIEGVFPGVCRRMYAGLSRRGFDEDTLVTFKVHVDADADHSREFLEALERCDLAPEDRARIVNGALAQLSARHAMFARLRRTMAG
jgi:hypothetical protein